MTVRNFMHAALRPVFRFKRKMPLLSYVAGRFATMVVILFALGFAIFGLMELAPGDIVDQVVMQQVFSGADTGVKADRTLTAAQIEATRASLGLDKPFYVQYLRWLKKVVVYHDLGTSLVSRAPVLFLIGTRLAN